MDAARRAQLGASTAQSDAQPLAEFERYFERFIRAHARENPLYHQIEHHFGYGDDAGQRGKRLRPKLVLAAAMSHGAQPDRAYAACAAIELLHNYSLIHDDIEDGDTLRHGRPTLWATFGVPLGINAGDAVGALAYLALEPLAIELGADIAARMLVALALANVQMCEGQALDLALEQKLRATTAEYVAMIEGKTASLFSCAAALGAHCAAASDEAVGRCADVGRLFGFGFQIQDDVRGIWGSASQTGKAAGGDIARRKKTYPIVWAMEHDRDGAGQSIAAAYAQSEKPLTDAAVAEVCNRLERAGARDAAIAQAEQYFDRAFELARELPPLAAYVAGAM